jgi:hypothetical protein
MAPWGWNPRSGVGVMVVVVRTMVMMSRGCEHRAGKHHQKQGSQENLFHGLNVARKRHKRQYPKVLVSN